MSIEPEEENQNQKARLRIFWMTSVFATFIYVLIVFLLLMVPGVEPVEELWLLLASAIILAMPLVIGSWKFWGGKAPITMRPFGRLVGVVLILELIYCVIGVVAEVLIILRKH
jgi:hypothetical protein